MDALRELVWSQVEGVGIALITTFAIFLALCALQIALAPRDRPRAEPPREFAVDMAYWSVVSSFRVLSRLVVLACVVLVSIAIGAAISPRLLQGFGPVMQQPKWLMLIELFMLTDFLTYWSHRACHRVPLLWRFHAVHHSPRKVHWTSTARLHPVNDVITYCSTVLPALALGFPFEALAPVAPVVALFAVWQHSKSNASLGPLSRAITSPLFHRWHHTHSDEGGDRNFAGVFAFWDVLFGTHYMPRGQVPTRFGLDDREMPESFWAQMVDPFRDPSAARAPSVELSTAREVPFNATQAR